MQALIKILKHSNCVITTSKNSIKIKASGKPSPIKFLETNPYPHFATDLQSPFLALQTVSKGVSNIQENLYETRFKIVPELIKMGAVITVKDRTATVLGVDKLVGAKVSAPDLRSGAGLIIAGLGAQGTTIITDIENIERGYLNVDKDLQSLGADIKKITLT